MHRRARSARCSGKLSRTNSATKAAFSDGSFVSCSRCKIASSISNFLLHELWDYKINKCSWDIITTIGNCSNCLLFQQEICLLTVSNVFLNVYDGLQLIICTESHVTPMGIR